jgi:hypothetical protein
MAGHYFSTVENAATGKPVSGATIKVYEAGATATGDQVTGGTFATIYSDDGITTVDQGNGSFITSNQRGFYEFWTDESSVVMEISYDGAPKFAVTDVEIVGGNVSGDLTALSARVDKHDTLFGTAPNATDLGTFTGATITDNTDLLGALQELETAVEAAATIPADPDADRIVFWDDSAGSLQFLEPSTGLTLSGTTLTADSTAIKPTESLLVACSDESTAIDATGTKITFRMPYAFTLSAVRASLNSACTTGTFTVDINEGGTTILSTKLTVDATEKTSTTAAAAAVISDSALADDAEITIDVDNVGDSTATGLKVTLIGTRT